MSVKAKKKRYQKFDFRIARTVSEKTGGRCYYCKSLLPENEKLYSPHGTIYMEIRRWHIDHLIPVARGGTDHIDNLVPSCISCNLKKHDKTVEEFISQGEPS